ncbi:hypothetical protein [Brucella sp.]|uniref:hypothetical protein n=1 Tax=Brucella sp. TaxID=52132 RepID=UPI0028A8D856|nr:hypothetical protein [Brucella sp.]
MSNPQDITSPSIDGAHRYTWGILSDVGDVLTEQNHPDREFFQQHVLKHFSIKGMGTYVSSARYAANRVISSVKSKPDAVKDSERFLKLLEQFA